MSTVRAKVADGRHVGALTRDDVIEALREYGRLYGPAFSQGAFNPATAKRNGWPELVDRYYKGRPDGRPWPSLNAIKTKFGGSWNEARAAAGFDPNPTGPAGGRRKNGEAKPILDVRERLVYVPNEKTKQLAEKVSRLHDRVRSLTEQRDRLREKVRNLRDRPTEKVVREKVVREPAKTKTKTITKTVKVRDERALERLRSKLADEQAIRRAVEDQLRAEQTAHRRDKGDLATNSERIDELKSEVKEATRERDRALDRLTASQQLVSDLHSEVEKAREKALGAAEAAAESTLVHRAEVRAEAAETRAARAERQMAEQGAAITGERRRLRPDELAELRSNGPAGPSVMADALKQLAKARSGHGDLGAALTVVASAAVQWRDRL